MTWPIYIFLTQINFRNWSKQKTACPFYMLNTVQFCYNGVNFLQNTCNKHVIACLIFIHLLGDNELKGIWYRTQSFWTLYLLLGMKGVELGLCVMEASRRDKCDMSSNMVPVRWTLHVFILKSRRLPNTSPVRLKHRERAYIINIT